MKRIDGYFVVLGGFLVHLSLGNHQISRNVESLIFNYINNSSYPKQNISMESAWLVGSTLVGLGAAVSFGGFLEMKIGSSLTVLLGGWFASFNTCMVYFTIKTYASIVIITYGLFVGFGTGIAYGVAIGTPVKLFLVRRGLIFGIISSAFGLSSGIFGPIQLELIKNAEKNLPYSFLIIGSIMAILQLLGALLLKSKEPEENSSEVESIVLSEENIFPNKTCQESIKEIMPHKLIFIPDFWILWLIFCLNSCSYTIFIMQFTVEFEHLSRGKTNYQLDFLVVYALLCFFGQIFWGFLVDKISFKKVSLVINFGSSVFIGTFLLINHINKNLLIYVCGAIIIFCYSGNFSTLPTICGNVFGMKYFVCNYGMIFTGCSVGTSMVGLVLLLNSILNQNILIFGSLFALIAFFITFLYKGKSDVVHLS